MLENWSALWQQQGSKLVIFSVGSFIWETSLEEYQSCISKLKSTSKLKYPCGPLALALALGLALTVWLGQIDASKAAVWALQGVS